MNTRTPIQYTDEELKKLFVSLGSIKTAKVAFILSKLDFSFIHMEQRDSKFSPENFVKLYLYKVIKGINTYNNLIKYLSNKNEDALQLGFYKDENNKIILPTKQALNKFFREKFGRDKKIELNTIAKSIIDQALEQKIVLTDINLVQKVITENKDKLKENKIDKKTEEITKIVKKIIYPQINLKMRGNGKFTSRDFLDTLVYVSFCNLFTTGGAKAFEKLNKKLNLNKQTPNGDLMLYHFSKFKSVEEIKGMFEKILDIIFEYTKQNYNLINVRKVNIAYDIHCVPYYGDPNNPFISEGKLDRGTTHFFRFLTCSIVTNGRFIIDVIPIAKLDNLYELLDKSLERVRKKVRIDKAFFDRGFDKPKFINIIKKNRIKFVMPKIKNNRIKAWMRKSEGCESRVIEKFEFGSEEKAVVNLIIVNDEKKRKRTFITNFYIPEQLAHYLFSWYSTRWGIETSYRQLEHDFKPKTTSTNYCIRLFYFLFSVCLYNLWVLVNICVSMTLFGRLKDKPIINAKLFTETLCYIFYDDPPPSN